MARRCQVRENGCTFAGEASEVDDAVSGVRHCGVDGFGCSQREKRGVRRGDFSVEV